MRKNYTKSPLTQGKKARARALGENGKIARVLCSPFLCHIPNKGTIKGDNKKHDLATFYYEILQNNKKKVFIGANILNLLQLYWQMLSRIIKMIQKRNEQDP